MMINKVKINYIVANAKDSLAKLITKEDILRNNSSVNSVNKSKTTIYNAPIISYKINKRVKCKRRGRGKKVKSKLILRKKIRLRKRRMKLLNRKNQRLRIIKHNKGVNKVLISKRKRKYIYMRRRRKRIEPYKWRRWLKKKFKRKKVFKRTLLKYIYGKVAKMYVNISVNNTHATTTFFDKNKIKHSIIFTSGSFTGLIKGTKRSRPIVTEMVIKRSIYKLKKLSKRTRVLHLYRSGMGRARSAVLKPRIKTRLKVHLRRDVTPVAHNGTRRENRRRV